MTEDAARKTLRAMLASFTPGSVLHLMADLFRADAEAARRGGDGLTAERCESVGAALAAVALGIDAACPR